MRQDWANSLECLQCIFFSMKIDCSLQSMMHVIILQIFHPGKQSCLDIFISLGLTISNRESKSAFGFCLFVGLSVSCKPEWLQLPAVKDCLERLMFPPLSPNYQLQLQYINYRYIQLCLICKG